MSFVYVTGSYGRHEASHYSDLDSMLNRYSKFLEWTSKEPQEVLQWIDDGKNRDAAFSKARQFSQAFYNVIRASAASDDHVRYLII